MKTLLCEFSWKSEIFGYPMTNSETWLELVNYHRDYLCDIFCWKTKIWWNIKTKVTNGVFWLICRSNAYNTSKNVFHEVCCAHSGSTLGNACFISQSWQDGFMYQHRFILFKTVWHVFASSMYMYLQKMRAKLFWSKKIWNNSAEDNFFQARNLTLIHYQYLREIHV